MRASLRHGKGSEDYYTFFLSTVRPLSRDRSKLVRGDGGDKAELSVLCFEFMEPVGWRAPTCECRLVSVIRGLSVTPLRVPGTSEWSSLK